MLGGESLGCGNETHARVSLATQRQTTSAISGEKEWSLQNQKRLFKFMDDLLDGHSPVQCLEDERLAKIVQDAFLHFAGERYKLLAYVVMPSHHHWLFLPNPDWSEKFLARQKQSGRLQTPREAISHSIQSYTANECNRVLDQTGRFWQHETYDHYARDEAEMFRIIAYIEQNPVKTGFVTKPAEYLWSSARLRAELNLAVGEPIQLS